MIISGKGKKVYVKTNYPEYFKASKVRYLTRCANVLKTQRRYTDCIRDYLVMSYVGANMSV